MISNPKHSLWLTLGGLGLLVILAAYLRVAGLNLSSITHPEMWVPGIRMPEEIADPRPRLTLWKVLTGTFSSDTHPPAFYVLMWAWTKCFGTSIWAIRLPAALFGIGCIPLLFWLATLIGQRRAGWVAAGLLAVNGYHVFWSDIARMYSMACFLGLLTTILLLHLARATRPRPGLSLAYLLVVLLGLTSHIFFWALFLTHILWTLLNARSRVQPLPGLCRLQILILILGSPLLAFAAYQSGWELIALSSNVLAFGKEYVQFSFLFPLQGAEGFFRSSSAAGNGQPHLWLLRSFFIVFSLLVLILGIRAMPQTNESLLNERSGPSRKLWVGAGALGLLAIWTFVVMAKKFVAKPNDTLRITELMSVLPLLLAGLGLLLETVWERLPNWSRHLAENRLLAGSQAVVTQLAIVPFAILSLISFFKPILNQRGMLFAAPYLLLVLACGIVSMARQRWAAISLLILLGILHVDSLLAYRAMRTDPADFRKFAAALTPRAEKTDLIFLQPNWSVTPILYYLTADRYQLIGQDYRQACLEHPNARVWALFFYGQGMTKEMAEALAEYPVLERIEMPYCRAVLFAPRKL